MQYKFRKGEVVWAKIRGFPWWPGMVPILLIQIAFIEESKPNYTESKILVNFIGDKSHAELTIDKLEKFKEKYKIIAIQYQIIRCRAICFFLLGNTILTLKKILVLNFKISFLRIAVYKDQR